MQTDNQTAQLTTLSDLVRLFDGRGDDAAIIALDRAGAVVARSYSEIARDVSRLAAGLARRGLSDGAMIMLWAPNSPEWVIAYLAITIAGNVVIPLDDQASGRDLDAVLHHSQPVCVFTTARHLPEFGAPDGVPGREFVLLDGDETDVLGWSRICSVGPAEPLPICRSDQVASLLYTSGTTGPPKAVPLTHANLMSNVRALVSAGLIAAADRVLVPLPLHHAYPATVGMLGPLAHGAVLILPSGISGPELTMAARQAEATVLLGVPRLYSAMMESIEAGIRQGHMTRVLYPLLMRTCIGLGRRFGVRAGRIVFRQVHRRVGASLRILASGGASLEPSLARKLEGLGWEVLTGYGLTETSPIVTFNARGRKRLESQGVPLSGVNIRIEKNRQEQYGEILVKGPNVFSGYWRNAAATQAAFTQDGWFRTGDLGYLDADGYLHVVGRCKELIVLADGKNVSPEDVERAYEVSPFIREVAVLERSGALVALIVPDEETIRRHGAMRIEALLREEIEAVMLSLPSYQRVAEYRLIRHGLPRTRLAKLRRHLLPEIFETAAKPAPAPVAAGDGDLQLLQSAPAGAAWLWLQERFAATGITLDSSPQLDLGIDSLEWVTLSSELEGKFGIVLSGEALSGVLTIRDLLRVIDTAGQKPLSKARHPVGMNGAERYLQQPGPALELLRWLLLALTRLIMRGFFRLRIKGLDRLPSDGPVVITPNHASYLDPLALAAALPRRLLANTCWAGWVGKMHKGPVFRAVSRATCVFPVDADRDLGGGIRLGAQVLENGGVLVWFPEGRRSRDGTVQPFQRGIGVLLEESKATAVPVRIGGSFAAWPLTRKWPRIRRITIAFGEPQTVDMLIAQGQGGDAADRICTALQRCVSSLAP